MRRFDYSFLKNELPSSMFSLSNVLADLRGRAEIRKEENKAVFSKLEEIAIIESVYSSNAIEGIVTTDSRFLEILSGSEPKTHAEAEIINYRKALDNIHLYHNSLDLTENYLLELHRVLMQDTSPLAAGRFKQNDNFIMEIDADGIRHIRFRPVSAAETPSAVEQMLLAYYEARQDAEIPQLLLIPCVILDFLCIHPFPDGNGRISRLLTILLLYLNDYDISRYISLEKEIEEYKGNYCEALQRSSENWHENRNDYVPFMINFLQILYQCFRKLDERFVNNSLKKLPKNKRVEELVKKTIVPLSKTDIEQKLPDISVKTIEKVLQKMVKERTVRKIGTFRNARYIGNK